MYKEIAYGLQKQLQQGNDDIGTIRSRLCRTTSSLSAGVSSHEAASRSCPQGSVSTTLHISIRHLKGGMFWAGSSWEQSCWFREASQLFRNSNISARAKDTNAGTEHRSIVYLGIRTLEEGNERRDRP